MMSSFSKKFINFCFQISVYATLQNKNHSSFVEVGHVVFPLATLKYIFWVFETVDLSIFCSCYVLWFLAR